MTKTKLLWLKLDKSFLKSDSDTYLAVVYISPENSSYSKNLMIHFSFFKINIAKYSQLGECMLLGDFNATTGTEPDYCHGDADAHLMDLPDNYIEDTPLPRCNIDNRKIDLQGERLPDLCKSFGLRIANGRILGDTLGYLTCYNPVAKMPSLIEYCIASASLLKDIRTLTVTIFQHTQFISLYQLN